MSSSRGRSLEDAPAAPLGSGRPWIVEFVGTPGAGKTTLCRELIRLLRDRGVEAATFTEAARDRVARTGIGRALSSAAPRSMRRALLWQVFYLMGVLHAFRFGREHAALISGVWRAQRRRSIPTAARRRTLYWFLHLAGRYRLLSGTSFEREVLVLDDGFVHRSVHLFASHAERPDADRVRRYVDLLPPPDLLLVAVASREVCARRVEERGVWAHRRHLSDAELSRYLTNAERVVDLAVRGARDRGWEVVEIPSEHGDLDQVRRALGEVLDTHPGIGRSRTGGPG